MGRVDSWVRFVLPACLAIVSQPAGAWQQSPGLILEFHDDSGRVVDARVSRMAAIYIPLDQPPTPFLEPGRFTAVWRGELLVPIRDRYTFSFHGRGSLEVRINDQPALNADWQEHATMTGPPVRLRQGPNSLFIRYRPPEEGDAQARLLWASTDFPSESLPPAALAHGPSQVLERSQQLRRGRQAMAVYRCLRCHAPPDGLVGDGTMPELFMDAPQLLDAGLRLNGPWLARWVANPSAHRADATMPRLVHGPAAGEEAADIAAYLLTLQFGAPPQAQAEASEQVQAGGQLYATLGCVGCHTLGPAKPADGPESARLDLRHVRAKFRPGALSQYLLNPAQGYRHTRMPDFKLSVDEAQALAAFLWAQSDVAPSDLPPGDPERGRQLVESRGCANCHTLPVTGRMAAPPAAQIKDWDRGCLAAKDADRGAAPASALNVEDRLAMRRLGEAGLTSLGRDAAAEYAERQLMRLQCAACHERDGQVDRWTRLEAQVAHLLTAPAPQTQEAGVPAPDQARPSLTWTGEKLRVNWLQRHVTGALLENVRPWLRSRMPAFPSLHRSFAAGWAMSHGIAPLDIPPAPADREIAAAGAMLLTKSRGFGCTDCHAIGSQPAQAVFEAQGVNLAYTVERLRPEFYDRWMFNPLRIDPRSKMPRYVDERGVTLLADILEGDGRRQFRAVWEHLALIASSRPAPSD
jgi:mono/diheme cytochrome c family protein